MTTQETCVLFWNINKKPLTENIARLVGGHDVQIVLLAESAYLDTPELLLDRLNAPPFTLSGDRRFSHITRGPVSPRVQVFARGPFSRWRSLKVRSRYTIWRVTTESGNTLLLTAAHFPSVWEEQGDEQRKTAVDLREDMDAVERFYTNEARGVKGFKGAPLVIVGDLNANPFDAGIAGVYGLNATQRRAVAGEGVRELDGRFYPFLYNPMWQFYGTREGAAPGTYYCRLSRPVCYDWFILDQVLIRPSLLTLMDDASVKILASDGVVSLVQGNDSRPRKGLSDHLPLVFTLRI